MKKIARWLYNRIPWKKHLFAGIKKIFTPSPAVFQHLHFRDIFQVAVDHTQFKIRHYGYQVENELFWRGLTGGWEKESMRMWIQLCRTHRSIVDIGANTGVYALVAKAINPEAKVYAFEPVQRVFDKLQHNIGLNGFSIHASSKAVSNTNGTAIIYDQPTEHIYSVTVNKNLSDANQRVKEVTIETITLSTFIEQEQLQSVDLIKIDVETHEPEVLEGMGSYLRQFKPTILIEVLNEEVGMKIENLVRDCGYLYFNIDEKNSPVQTAHITQSAYYNYLLCSKETAQFLSLVPTHPS